MGNCIYCGEPAGFLRKKHPGCEKKTQQQQQIAQEARIKMAFEASRALKNRASLQELEATISDIETCSSVPISERKVHLAKGWEDAVEKFLEDGILDQSEEVELIKFQQHFSLNQELLDKNGAFTKVVKAAILRDVLEGKVPERLNLDVKLPINLQKAEKIVWVFSNSKYLEDKTRRTYVGRSQGVSIRVMKGVYYRIGAFKGNSIEYTERVHIDTGWVVFTNKSIYFSGPKKSTRIPYAKVVSFEPFSDGLGLCRDATTAKPQIFVTGDGWFSYNLATNLAQLYS